MKKRYIVALDSGTTSVRAICYDTLKQSICGVSSSPISLYYPKSGWVEQDATEIWERQLGALRQAMVDCGITHEEVISIGITNQRETVVVWDKLTGKPISNAIVWQCRRTADEMQKLAADTVLAAEIKKKTGLVCDAYFSASKIAWILQNVEGARARAEAGQLLAGTIDSWIVYNLTEGKTHATDVTNASRTMLFDINKLCYDAELLRLFDVPSCMLPAVFDSDAKFGTSRLLGGEIDICGILGDQQAALFGQACFNIGEAKNTYGTGCFILLNTGNLPAASDNNLISTIAWKVNSHTTYALEGSIFNAGSSVQWLRDNLKFFKNARESEALATSVSDTGGVYVVPAFTGLGAPYWDSQARGIITGISRGSTAAHITRATLEAMAYSTRDITSIMTCACGKSLRRLCVDGGASENDFLMQFQADILGVKIERPRVTESTVLGAVFVSCLGMGIFDIDKIASLKTPEREFLPTMPREVAQQKYEGWQAAIRQCRAK